MALLDVFKTKSAKDDKRKTEKKISEDIKVEKKVEKKAEAEKAVNQDKSNKAFSQIAARILKAPHVTEKAMSLGRENKYIFKVTPNANKPEIKKAIQELYGVRVKDVNIINIPRKKRRLGRSEGFKSGFKKAVVTLKQGEKIETGA